MFQNLLDPGELGEEADHSLSQHHVVLTRQGWNLAEKKRRLDQQQAEIEAARSICEKYAEMDDDDFFGFHESLFPGQLAQFELDIVRAEYSKRR